MIYSKRKNLYNVSPSNSWTPRAATLAALLDATPLGPPPPPLCEQPWAVTEVEGN